MEEEEVNKASHCAWQIHYHVVMPVKYRKALMGTGKSGHHEKGNWAMIERYILGQGKPKEDLRQLTLW